MKNILSDLAYDITQIIKGSGRVILMYDEDGNRTYEQREASKIFAYPDKMMIMITDDGIDSTVDVALSDSTDVIELQDFINTLRHLTTNYNVLFNIQKYGKEIQPKDFANFGPTDISECLDYYNLERVDELFKGDSDVEITQVDDRNYCFTVGDVSYQVLWSFSGEIYFSTKKDSGEMISPIKKNKNQFIVLNTVVSIIKEIINSNPFKLFFFSGSRGNGLAKIYSLMAKELDKSMIDMDRSILITDNGYRWNIFDDKWVKDAHPDAQYFYLVPFTQEGDKMIEEYEQITHNVSESRIDELFKGDSDVEIKEEGNRYSFVIDESTYDVNIELTGEIIFSVTKNGVKKMSPVKNNKNQFLVLNTVVSIVRKIILKYPNEVLYFTGDRSNGLAKVYSAMANILKKDLPKHSTLIIPPPRVRLNWSKRWTESPFSGSPQYYYIIPDTDDGKFILDNYQEFIDSRVDEATLSDYKTIKNNDWGLPSNLIEWLKGKGFKMIGEGHYSYIFSSETEDFVVKVNNGKHMDEGYLNFVEFCQQNKGNPHLPKMGQIKKYDNWYIVFIEKLEDFTELDGQRKIELVIDIRDEADDWKTSMTGDIAKQVKDCGKLLKQIKHLGNDDFHVDNLMKRGDTLVITDPLR